MPGCHKHHDGENDYPNILKAIHSAGYERFFNVEYWLPPLAANRWQMFRSISINPPPDHL